MLPDRVSNPGPLTYESDALPINEGMHICLNDELFYLQLYSSIEQPLLR